MQTNTYKILLAEDGFVNAVNVSDAVEHAGYDVCVTNNVKEALSILESTFINAAILDYELLDGTIEPIATCLQFSHIPYAIVSGAERSALLSKGLHANHIYSKPADYNEIIQSLTLSRH